MSGALLFVREASASIRLRTRVAMSPVQIRPSADLKCNMTPIYIMSSIAKK